MKNKYDYGWTTGVSPAQILKNVNEMKIDGWEPLGGMVPVIVNNSENYLQTMIRWNNKQKHENNIKKTKIDLKIDDEQSKKDIKEKYKNKI